MFLWTTLPCSFLSLFLCLVISSNFTFLLSFILFSISVFQRKRHYWRLDSKCITLFQNDTGSKYYKVKKSSVTISSTIFDKLTSLQITSSFWDRNSKHPFSCCSYNKSLFFSTKLNLFWEISETFFLRLPLSYPSSVCRRSLCQRSCLWSRLRHFLCFLMEPTLTALRSPQHRWFTTSERTCRELNHLAAAFWWIIGCSVCR